ncbi:MAG: DUF2891 domain-containing protein [Deltaproteobacteria bacterium]|nr:DUF2891 domain-containing protein [Deltaproteobacteria bacterium]
MSSRHLDRDRAAALAAILRANLTTARPYLQVALLDDDHVADPRAATPMFASAFDWHSSVHNHWALVRLAPWLEDADRAAGEAILAASLTANHAAIEARHLRRFPGFELPYGLAWVLTLAAELREGGDARAPEIAELEAIARDRLVGWAARIPAPIRSGEHSQSALAMALAIDWARATGDREVDDALVGAARRLHGHEHDAPLHWEPSAHDFVSPALGAAWLMTRVLGGRDYAAWLDRFAPTLGRGADYAPVTPIDRVDGKLVHWDGLNLSRAWMLDGIAAALGEDPRAPALFAAAASHGLAGLRALEGASYAGNHWLPSFAVYWLTAPARSLAP